MLKRILQIILIAILSLNCGTTHQNENAELSHRKAENNLELEEKSFSVDVDKSQIKWVGRKIASSHDGVVDIASGEITLKGLQLQSAEIVVDMTTIQNKDIESEEYRAKLTGHLKDEDFFNVSEYPTSTLKINKSEDLGNSNFRFFGDLTIKGISHPLEFEGKVEENSGKFNSIINLVFDRTKWDIRYGSGKFFEDLGDKMILDNIELEVTISTL